MLYNPTISPRLPKGAAMSDKKSEKENEINLKRFLLLANKYLCSEFPEKTSLLQEDDLDNKILDYCRFAFNHGFKNELEVMRIVDLMWRLAPVEKENKELSWFFLILERTSMSNDLRLDALENAYAMYMANKM